jgi:predicted RNA-binding protein YlqC (UPF0109 family)
MIIRIADTQWAVASSEQGAREYLRIAHQADLVLDASRTTGLIVCAKDHAGHIIGKEGRNIKRLAEACGVERLTVRVRKASPLKENPQAS